MEVEKYQPLNAASAITGIPYYKLQRAAKRGLIPTYTLLNGRALVLISEIQAVMRRSAKGRR